MLTDWIVKTFSPFHIVFILLIIPIMVGTLILFKTKAKTDKAVNLTLYIAAGILLAVIIGQRISIVYWGIKDGIMKDVFGELRLYNWFMILPDSICGLTSLCVPIFVFAWRGKNNNHLIEAVFSISMLGCLGTIFYPDYLNFQPLWQMRCWGGLIHHTLSGWICLAMLLKGKFTPSLKRWYLNPIAIIAIDAYGFFCLFVLKFSTCMNISSPLISDIPLSNWWILSIGYALINTLFLLVWELTHRKKKQEEAKGSK